MDLHDECLKRGKTDAGRTATAVWGSRGPPPPALCRRIGARLASKMPSLFLPPQNSLHQLNSVIIRWACAEVRVTAGIQGARGLRSEGTPEKHKAQTITETVHSHGWFLLTA